MDQGMAIAAALRVAAALFGGDELAWGRFARGLSGPVRRGLFHGWAWQAHRGQEVPAGDWRTWLMMAGRGFGKTRAGAEWVWARAREGAEVRIALVGASREEVARVMVEGPSGLLALARADEAPVWLPTRGEFRFPGGAVAFSYSAAAPEALRGPEHHFAWCDELGKWDAGASGANERAWDNLQMGLRLGERPRAVVTTTPRAVALVRRVKDAGSTEVTGGRTADNVHLSEAFRDWAVETYGGTRLGRQELDGMLFEEVAGSLFPREVLEASRQSGTLPREEFARVVVGVDPPASAEGDACGIVVCGLGRDGVAYVLADCSVAGARPEGWARSVARAAEAWGADRVVAEKNQGGDMVESVLAQADCALPVKLVSASRGKTARAEPVAARMEGGKVRLAGRFPELEDELAGLSVGGGYQGPGRSPDRADACVWALSELIRPAPEPRILVH
jgi:phage terminase large subunit-like protein